MSRQREKHDNTVKKQSIMRKLTLLYDFSKMRVFRGAGGGGGAMCQPRGAELGSCVKKKPDHTKTERPRVRRRGGQWAK